MPMGRVMARTFSGTPNQLWKFWRKKVRYLKIHSRPILMTQPMTNHRFRAGRSQFLLIWSATTQSAKVIPMSRSR